ncbi:helix-turn-helix domain-containing protein [Cystobacter fuscus]
MPTLDIKPLLVTETDRIEWKESAREDKILQAVCALANDLGDTRRPGYLLVGVDKNGGIKGIAATGTGIDEELRTLSDRLRSIKILPTPTFDLEALEVEGRLLFAITVHPAPVLPVAVDSVVWVRSGTTTVRARDADLQRLRDRQSAQNRTFDSRIVANATLDDLNIAELQREYDAEKEIDDEQDSFPPLENWLMQRQLVERVHGTWRPNHTAILAYGRSPQTFLPGAYVDFIRYTGTDVDAEIASRKTATGTLSDQLDVLWAQLEANNSSTPPVRWASSTVRQRLPAPGAQGARAESRAAPRVRRNQRPLTSRVVRRPGGVLQSGSPLWQGQRRLLR